MTRATKNALALALGVALLSFAFGLPFLFDPCDWFDDGYMAIPGLRIRHGELPYRDFLLNVPPGSPYVHAFLQRTFGLDASVRRLYSFAEVSATIGILAWAARRFASARAVWLVGGVFALWSPATTTLLAHCNLDALLCSSAGLAIAIGGTGPSRRRLVLAGAVAGAGVWFKHSNAVAALAGVAAAAAWLVPASPRRIRGTIEAKVLVLAGAVPVVLALVLWILANGVVERFIICAFRSALEGRQVSLPAAFARAVALGFESPAAILLAGALAVVLLLPPRARTTATTVLLGGAGVTVLVYLLGYDRAHIQEPAFAAWGVVLLGTAFSVATCVRGGPGGERARPLAALGCFALAAMLGALATGHDYGHFIFGVPALFPFLAASADRLLEPGAGARLRRGALAACAGAFAAWAAVTAARHQVLIPVARSEPFATYTDPGVRGIHDSARLVAERDAAAAFLRGRLAPGETFLTYPNDELPYLLLDRTPPLYATTFFWEPPFCLERFEERLAPVRYFLVTSEERPNRATLVPGLDFARKDDTLDLSWFILAHCVRRGEGGAYLTVYERADRFAPEAVSLPGVPSRNVAIFAAAVAGREYGQDLPDESAALRAGTLRKIADSPRVDPRLARRCRARASRLAPEGAALPESFQAALAAARLEEAEGTRPLVARLTLEQGRALEAGEMTRAHALTWALVEAMAR